MRVFSRILMLFKAKASSALDRVEDPRQVLDYAYAQQQEMLVRTKQGLVEVATSKVRLEQQAARLRDRVPRTEDQAMRALTAGREDLARVALARKQTILGELEGLDIQIAEVGADEARLTQAEQQLAVRIDEFRTRRDVISARYTAAQAQVRATEALTGVSGEFAELGMALGRAVEKTERVQARAAAISTLLDTGTLSLPVHGGDVVEAELIRATAEHTVEEEMTSMKAKLVADEPPRALEQGSES